MIVDITHAIKALCPTAQFAVRNDEYAGIEWHSHDVQKPTEAQVNAKLAEMQAQYDAAQYQRKRANAYPSLADQLDTLYHGGFDAWRAQIQAVKEQFPKPEVTE